MDGFTRLAGGGCPPIADLMLALAAEFHDADCGAADERLDELALPLFGLAERDLRVAAARLAASSTPTPASTPTARASPAHGLIQRRAARAPSFRTPQGGNWTLAGPAGRRRAR